MVELLNVELEGFGKFTRKTVFNFSRGINFIFGLNETGKSTVLEAIMASIFKYTSNEIEPFFCWNNKNVCRTVLTYKTDKGEVYRITSDYKSGRRELEKLEKSRTVEISSVEKNIKPLLKEHFGFDNKKVFENTTFIRQTQMAILEDGTSKSRMKDMIEEVFAGRAGASATKALTKIKKIINDYQKDVDRLRTESGELDDKLKSAEETKSDLTKDSEEFEDAKKNFEKKSKELDKLQKNRKLFDEKEGLLKDKKHIEEQIKNIDDMLETLNEEKEEPKPISNRTVGIVLIVLGIIISLTVIGAIIGIPLVYYGYKRYKAKGKPIVKKDENIKKYEKKKGKLIDDKAVVESQLKEYKLVNFTIDDFRELDDLQKEVESLKDRKVTLQTSIKKTTELVESPEEIKEKLDVIEQELSDLKNKIEEHRLAFKFLGLAETEVHQKFTPAMQKNCKPILKAVTDNRYADVKIDEETLDVEVRAPEIGEFVNVYYLSQGAKDQLYFALRTVMSNLLSGNINVPLILDDPFHSFDDPRLDKTIEIVKKISKNKQIILISHRPYHEVFRNFADNFIKV
jgi:DNA repair exonuclease SbcCD ATPase subunit